MSAVYYGITNHQQTAQPKITLKSHLGPHRSLQPCSSVCFVTKLLENSPPHTQCPSAHSLHDPLLHRVFLLKQLSAEDPSYFLHAEPSQQLSVFSNVTPSLLGKSPSPSDSLSLIHLACVLPLSSHYLLPGLIPLHEGYLPAPRSCFRLLIPTCLD